MDDFSPSENLSGVEQLKRSAAIATQNVACLRRQLENEPDEFTRSSLLKLLLHEAEKSRLTHQQLDRIDCHMAELRELTYRQVELVEKGNLKGQIVERAVKLRALLNDLMALLSNGGGGILVRVALVCVCGLGAGILGAGCTAAEDLAPEQASAFVVGKLFSYTCFEGTAGMGRIFPDGSVVGTIRICSEGETRFAALPPGTIRVDGPAICAHLSGLPITPCFRVQRIDNRSFRGSVAGLDFAYCDFYQRNPRTHLVSNPANLPATQMTTQRSMRLSLHE
jgi:hypothetical protein